MAGTSCWIRTPQDVGRFLPHPYPLPLGEGSRPAGPGLGRQSLRQASDGERIGVGAEKQIAKRVLQKKPKPRRENCRNFGRGFVQPGNAINPPLRSGLSTFLQVFGRTARRTSVRPPALSACRYERTEPLGACCLLLGADDEPVYLASVAGRQCLVEGPGLFVFLEFGRLRC